MAKQIKKGQVINICSKNTIKVRIVSLKNHPKYHKKYKVSKNFLVDSPNNKFQIGQVVHIKETRPLSRRKHFEVIK